MSATPAVGAIDGSDTVIAEIDKIRRQFGDGRSLKKAEQRATLTRALSDSRGLRDEPIIEALIDDLRDFDERPHLTRTKRHINERRDGRIISAFDAPYFASLSFDGLTYRELPADDHLATRYPSPATPVVVESMSEGFRPQHVVVLFPENHIDGSQQPHDRIFYFIDKFVERHVALTPSLIEAATAEGSFRRVRAERLEQVEQAASWWTQLHEHHHLQGAMPIPEYLSCKSSKPLAALEEMRVDVLSMLACLNDEQLPREEALFAYEFILAERLLRYAVEGYPRPNYDGVASQILFNYLREAGAIRLRDGLIHLTPSLPDALAAFADDVAAIEARVHSQPPETARRDLLAFANHYANVDRTTNDYDHLPYFAMIKSRIGERR